MKILLLILILNIFQLNSEGKTIVVKTSIKNLKKEKVGLFHSRQQYVWNYSYYKEHNIFEIDKGEIIYEFYSKDSLIIEIGKNIPLFIKGISKIQSDSIIISNFKLTKYTSIDSSLTIASKNIRNKKGNYRTKQRNYSPLGSKQIVSENLTIKINGKEYTCNIISEPYNITSTYCTPGKVSYVVKTEGVRKYYCLVL